MKSVQYGMYFVSAIFLFFVAYRIYVSITLLTSGQKVTAIIVDYETSESYSEDRQTGVKVKNTWYHPVVEFTTQQSGRIQVKMNTGELSMKKKVGESIDIVVDINNPSTVQENNFIGFWGLPIALFVFSGLFYLAGVLFKKFA